MEKNSKKIVAITCTCVLTLSSLILGLYFLLTNSTSAKMENLDGYIIKNFANYKSIGAADIIENNANVLTTSYNSNISIRTTSNSQRKKKKVIIGQTEDNIEVVEFEKDSDIARPSWYVADMDVTKNFTFIMFSRYENVGYPGHFLNNEDIVTYIVDNNTGRFYKFDKFEYFVHYAYGYGSVGYESENSHIIYSFINGVLTYFRISIENELLKVEEIFNSKLLPGYSELRLTDKYGNAIIYRYDDGKYSYILRRDGTLNNLGFYMSTHGGMGINGEAIKAYNGIIYYYDKEINADGELVDAVLDLPKHVLSRTHLISSNGNKKYYYGKSEYIDKYASFWNEGNSIIEITELGGDNFSARRIPVSISTYNMIIASSHLVTFNDTTISLFSLETETTQSITIGNGIIIKSVTTYDYQEIFFTGINESLQNIVGKVKVDGTIEYDATPPDFQIFYLKAIN